MAFVAFGLRLGHEAGGLRPPLASPAPMLRSRASPGSDARHWSPDVILVGQTLSAVITWCWVRAERRSRIHSTSCLRVK